MIVVGLDLSTSRCGFSILNEHEELLAVGYEEPSGSICDKLVEIADWLENILRRAEELSSLCPGRIYVAIEYPRGWAMNTMFLLGRINGMVHYLIRQRWGDLVCDFAEYGPEKGKMALSIKGNANKDVQKVSFEKKYPNWTHKRVLWKPNSKLEDILTDDEADACGIALAVLQKREAIYVSSLGRKGVML
jgi:Holliday junction resolvasome RuvABC endonuclease subunit